MEVRPGYKLTEVGLIPEDWEVKTLSELGTVVRGGSPRPAGDPRFFNGNYIPWLTVAALTNIPDHQQRVTETASFLTEAGSRQSRRLASGTLIIANSGATLGVTKLLGVDCCANDGIAAIIAQHSGDRSFLGFYVNTRLRELREVIATGNGQPNLNTGLIGKIIVPFPSSQEQESIAEALSDVDALLGGLERLITKKRDLKQAAMQQLLTGQTRLPCFTDEWAEKTLADLGDVYGGLSGKTKADFDNGSFPYITFMNVMTNVAIDEQIFGLVKVAPTEAQNRVLKGDLLFNGSSETPEEVAMCAILKNNIANLFLNSFCFGFRMRRADEADGLFLVYFLRSKQGREVMKSLAQGSTRYNISKKALLNSALRLPGVKEQTAIAAVLTDMDAEIAALEQRLAKTRALKQGMMQELLTGRIQLMTPEVPRA
jgi:type I restriction enzyme S subunit